MDFVAIIIHVGYTQDNQTENGHVVGPLSQRRSSVSLMIFSGLSLKDTISSDYVNTLYSSMQLLMNTLKLLKALTLDSAA